MSRTFTSLKNMKFLTMRVAAVGQLSTGQKQEGIRGRYVLTGDCRVWAETAKGGERICNYKSASKMSVSI
jgi:hypothetical protein